MKASTRPSATACEARRLGAASGEFIMRRKEYLDRLEDIAVDRIDRCDHQSDDDEDERRVVILPRQVEEMAEAGVAAEQLGGQCCLPRNAEADPQRREDEGRQGRQ